MKTSYELWDTQDSNLVGTFPTEEAALAVVRYSVGRFGASSMESVALGCETEAGQLVPVAQGNALIQLAFERGDDHTFRRAYQVFNSLAAQCGQRLRHLHAGRGLRKRLKLT